ncbi:hypothetical protein B0T17DRAFT_617848 [Bombardia bombarda]|uniref:Uncharacterized protein n=1 Tax=Bombardia bombarda TaxID=252184 RepID=A0AA39WTN5_9PEZI|nr:hypothetical protein B0T17DRAFT_617848 [Bombardia bombarda]
MPPPGDPAIRGAILSGYLARLNQFRVDKARRLALELDEISFDKSTGLICIKGLEFNLLRPEVEEFIRGDNRARLTQFINDKSGMNSEGTTYRWPKQLISIAQRILDSENVSRDADYPIQAVCELIQKRGPKEHKDWLKGSQGQGKVTLESLAKAMSRLEGLDEAKALKDIGRRCKILHGEYAEYHCSWLEMTEEQKSHTALEKQTAKVNKRKREANIEQDFDESSSDDLIKKGGLSSSVACLLHIFGAMA